MFQNDHAEDNQLNFWKPDSEVLVASISILPLTVTIRAAQDLARHPWHCWQRRAIGTADSGAIDLTKDVHFDPYSTFAGKVDWKFTHKNHLYVLAHSSINAAALVTGEGVHHPAVYAADSMVAPISVGGSEFRYYLTNSPGFFVQAAHTECISLVMETSLTSAEGPFDRANLQIQPGRFHRFAQAAANSMFTFIVLDSHWNIRPQSIQTS